MDCRNQGRKAFGTFRAHGCPYGEGRGDIERAMRNMPKGEGIEVEGTVVEPLPNAMFRVELPNGHRVLAHVSGKMRMNYIKILPEIRLSSALAVRLTRGRIIYRAK